MDQSPDWKIVSKQDKNQALMQVYGQLTEVWQKKICYHSESACFTDIWGAYWNACLKLSSVMCVSTWNLFSKKKTKTDICGCQHFDF